ncbi:MAG: Na+/H+ antiporter subunit E [Clostridia bacterium]|nr:Na+/H+ antiporter subunit E [Clostridia bacterium]
MLNKVALFFSLMIFWFVLNGGFDVRQFVSALFCSGFTVYVTSELFKRSGSQPVRIPSFWRIVWFVGIVFKEIFIAAYAHILRIISGEDTAKIFRVHLDVTDEFAVAMIANAITLTPGTITLGMDGNKLVVVGYAKNKEEVKDIKSTILVDFQKPFLWGAR